MTVPFSKYQATGNDFILIDNRNGLFKFTSEQIALLCQRKLGIGADGLILLQNHSQAHFEMVYFNADGKLGSFCGNGSRAAVLFAKQIGAVASSFVTFSAYDGLHQAFVLSHAVRIQMNPYQHFKALNDHEFFLDTGSPHHVVFVDDIQNCPVIEKGKEIRNDDSYQPHGTNVDFVSIQNDGIFVRTYERGVENETLSCGTGVTASAICYLLKNQKNTGEVKVFTLGGNLKVSVLSEKEIFLEGPVQQVFYGYVNI
jgi:diaminopimelate epimerase